MQEFTYIVIALVHSDAFGEISVIHMCAVPEGSCEIFGRLFKKM
ncbi:MAG: hypothetical protein ACPKPY_06180 [Nitrososphaeraceae archaeon]